MTPHDQSIIGRQYHEQHQRLRAEAAQDGAAGAAASHADDDSDKPDANDGSAAHGPNASHGSAAHIGIAQKRRSICRVERPDDSDSSEREFDDQQTRPSGLGSRSEIATKPSRSTDKETVG